MSSIASQYKTFIEIAIKNTGKIMRQFNLLDITDKPVDVEMRITEKLDWDKEVGKAYDFLKIPYLSKLFDYSVGLITIQTNPAKAFHQKMIPVSYGDVNSETVMPMVPFMRIEGEPEGEVEIPCHFKINKGDFLMYQIHPNIEVVFKLYLKFPTQPKI